RASEPGAAARLIAEGGGGGPADAADPQAHRAAVCRTAEHWVAAYADLARCHALAGAQVT
ncbi:hypothetical protein, partial [Actinomadura sp. NPDC049753]|uniref:hypothetical protein n=1 Tax=Actinomadura sp. NPDC049753 TaxID=3154739 RepID=UPI0034365C97